MTLTHLETWLIAALIIMHLLGAYITFQYFAFYQFVNLKKQQPWLDFILCLVAWEIATITVIFERKEMTNDQNKT